MKKIRQLIEVYGPYAIGTYLAIFALVLGGFAAAIQLGFEPEGMAGNAGTLVAAWLATKATQPVRIGATFALTPLVARLMRRPPAPETVDTDTGTDPVGGEIG